ncbi:DUF3828 domain-containing protein [Rhizobium sp. CFBP 8752]|uniref:DUF3828 domain-containing protein n=1 Tax=Rhizobium sp. CFBP 8752 TaxID=2775301 RepID=UPI00177CAE7D|nr:DUF3828 domain-containing protein [Rhizobium sp. CFBP 8752]MBD8662885.1 DUF3828 domain-containing protein [Rhizobium sp. CFBP 8752]
MRPLTTLLALLLLTLSVLPASAEVFKTPQALIRALYAYDIAATADDAPSPYQPFLSRSLNRLFQKDRDGTAEGEVGAVDFDPVIAGQDGEAKGVKLSPPILIDDQAELEVSFLNGSEKVTLYYTLKRENGGWKVDDIANQQGEYSWSLRDLLGGQ